MMKRTLAIMLVALLFAASSAYAVDFETKGMYYARGSYISNYNGQIADDVPSFGYYDSELDMTVALKVTDYTKIITNFEIRDQSWHQSQLDDSTIADGDQWDDMIEFKRVFSTHTFSTGTTVDLGLMTGFAWGTSFADTANGCWRVKAMQKFDFGYMGAVLQKDTEMGETNPTVEDSEKDDGDSYYLFGIFPVGTHKIMPLLIYSDRSDVIADQDSDGLKVTGVHLAFAGAFGPSLGYEAEFDFVSYNQDWTGGEDYSLMGAYVNVWTMMGATKLGGQVAYGSWDDDAGKGFGFGEDYTPTMFGADFAAIGGNEEKSEYSAVTLIQLYANHALSEELSIFGNGTYWMSNTDENADGTDNKWKDATGYEIDLGGDYKITANVTYSLLAAYGQIQFDEDAAGYDDADAFYRLYHKFTINF